MGVMSAVTEKISQEEIVPMDDIFASPMFKDKSIKRKANETEKKLAKQMGLKQQPSSGARDTHKGDFTKIARGRKWTGDMKSMQGNKTKSLRVTSEMIYKIISDMHEERGDEWFIPLVFEGKLMGVVISPELFAELTED